jgi:hypothetical protein
MALVPVHVTLMNGLDEVMTHQDEIVADAVPCLDVDAVIDTLSFGVQTTSVKHLLLTCYTHHGDSVKCPD